ncbi:hypothetical protein PFAG_05661 [Plasmodium falciparum Santa Lucia]|uniref:SCD domain-containing protein n=1 Tax=Plasmodium falciparum Santa Lucia TaxID=478859 RepID=W7FMM7_PLAFA|nr:hypothetical protein PFAG_05661 [Plasmodium falciparum Santa Lucia]
MDNNKMFLRRSSRLSHNFDENNRNRELIEKREGGNMVKKQITHERRKSIYKDKDESLLSTDENSSTYDSDYTVSVNDDDSSVGNKRKYNKENENNKNNNNNNNNRHNRRNKNKHNNNNNNSSGDNSNAITPFYDGDKNKDNECIENVRTRKNNNYEKNNLKNNSYIDILNEDIDDEDFDIFKRSKMDRSKRISTSYKNTQYNDINLRKRKSVYVESSNSEDSNKSDDDDEEYINEESSRNNKKKKLKQTYSSSTFKNKKNFVNKKVYKNFEDFNLYENIKKNPKNLHDIIEEIYYSLFNKDTNEKVKISTFFLNFLAECSGNETLTWTVDIIDYIDKQIYLYEDIPNNNQLQNVIIGNTINNTTLSDIMTPSTVRSSNKITNMDEIIRDENNFEKVCTFKCEKLEQYLSTDLNTDVLIKIKNENNKSYKAFANFFADFSFHFDENYIYDILYICIWIFSLSVSKYRKIRFTSSLASLSILLGLCKKIRYINNHERQSRKQLMAEYTRERKNINNLTGAGRKRNSSTTITRTSNTIHNNNNNNNNSNNSTLDIINDDRSLNIEDLINYKNKKDTELYNIVERNLIISQLIDNINEDRKNLTILNNFLLCTYNILYKNKIKDIFIDIRIITLEYFYLYLDVLTLYFTNRKFTKLLIWILYDKDNKIKICCLKILIYLCNYYNNSNKKIFKIVELLYMSKKKLLNLIFDSDYNVRIKTFELILEMNKMKLNRTEFLHFKKTLKNKKNSAHNKKDDPHINDNTSSSEYEEDTDVNSTESEKIQNKKSIVLYNHNKRNKKNIGNKQNHDGKEDDIYVISDNMCILSTKEKKIVSNLIWFNNNNKISQMITSLIYESQIKNKIKNYEKRKHNYFDVEHNDTNSEIVKYNIIYLTKYLNKNIPTVKNFVHYFDYMKNYNENLKLYTVIDKFISGIREKLDCINNIDIIIELLCEDDISLSYIGKKKGSDKTNDKEKDMGEDENNVQLSQRFNNNDNNVIDGERVIDGEHVIDDGEHVIDGERVTENNTETRKHSTYLSHDCDKNNSDKGRDLRKCLLYICESSYRNLQNDINEMEKNKNRKGTSASTNSNNINNINNNVNINGVLLSDKNTAHSKLNNDTNKIKKMIIYTFYIIKNSKQLIKLHQTNQEHLLLVFKILKIALYECKHIYKHEEKNNIYNFSSTIMEYFKNDIESNMNYFFNNIYIYLKETYEYLFYLLKNYKLPYYSSKYTMNIISIFLSLNDSLKGSNKLSSDLFFDLYYTYFNNFLENFLYYQKNYNMEVDRNEEDNKGEDESDTHDEHGEDNVYLLNKKRKIILISENLVNKDKNIIEAIEEEIILNLTNLIHIYTLGFNYINNDLSNYKDIKNDILKKKKNIEKSIKMLCEQDYFSIKVKEKCQSFFFKDNIINLNEFLEENLLTSYYDENDIESYTHENNIQSDQYSEDVEMSYDDNDEDINYIGKKKNKNNKQKDKNKHNNINNINKRKTMNIQDILHLNDNMTKNNKNSSYIQSEEENFQYEQNLHNLYYSSDACIHANVIIHLCLHIIKAKVNSIYYYDEDVVLHTPSSRLLLLCIDQIYIIYENYIYHLCKKRYFFNFLYNIFLHKYKNDKIDGKKNEWEKKNEGEKKNRNNQHNLNDNESNLENNIQNNNIKIEINENDKSEKNNNIDDNKNKNNKENDSNNINLEDLKKLHNLNNKKIDALKNIFIELNYIYANISTLRKDINHVLIFLIRSCNNTILRYGTFLNLMNIAQLENILLYSIEDLNKYKTLELFLNKIKNNDEIGSCMDIHIKEDMENYLDKDEEINKYKNVSRYIYKDDNILFNFVTELFKYVENMNNNNYNFVNSFLSIDISVFFPINTYTYIADMCKIYNKDVLSKNEKILEMQYMHMTLIIAQFILNCNNINIFNSCLGVLLLIHLNVKNKGLSSIALNFHNKLKKYNIDVFYEVLLCALIGLYTAYINNALEEKDLLLFSASIASRLGVKIVEKQKLPLCKFIHSCVNCALNLKNQNSFLKYILPYAQKLSLSEYQLNYLKKQILNLIDSYNVANQSHIKYENSIFEHMMLIICKKRKLNDEFKDINYENSYMNLNESIHMNISKNIINRNRQSEASTIIKTRKSVLQMNRNKDNDQVDKMNDDENKDEDNDGNNNNDSYNNDIQNDDLSDENNNIDKKKSSNDEDNINSESDINENNYVNQNMRHYRIKKELIHHENEHAEKEQTNNIHKAKDKYKRINKQNYGNEKNNSNNNEIYSELDEKSHSNSTLSDLVSLNDEDNNNNNNDKGKSHYDMNSSPKPVRSKKYNNMHVIPKYNSELNMNDTDNKSMDINTKHSVDISLNSSLGNISYKDDDNMSLISDVKGKNKYFTQNADDSNSDIVPGMSPIKKNDGKRSELSTPISYADDLMNF